MSLETLEQMKKLDLQDLSLQLALQCAPLLAGLKCSNLLITDKNQVRDMKKRLEGSDISFRLWMAKGNRLTWFFFREKSLENYVAQSDVSEYFTKCGYSDLSLNSILSRCAYAYRQHQEGLAPFPHEMGLLLGYPLEDVEGFVKNQGKNYLYAGYWKVYEKLPEKVKLFKHYERAKEYLVCRVLGGCSPKQMIHLAKPA